MLKKAAFQSVGLMLWVIVLSFAIEMYNPVAISANNSPLETENAEAIDEPNLQESFAALEPKYIENQDVQILDDPHLIKTSLERDISKDILNQLGELYLVIRKPEGKDLQLQLEDLYITKRLLLNISGLTETDPKAEHLGRVNGDSIFKGEPLYIHEEGTQAELITKADPKDPINEIIITSHIDDMGRNVHEIMLSLDHVYTHFIYEDENFYYIDLKRPKDVYDKVLVIDSGHGGKDPGALSRDERIYEKNINLEILLELKKYLDKDNIKVYYTKLTDETLYLRPRVTLANDVECDFFISIHCNSSTYKSPNGTEILYYNHENNNIKTKDLANIFSEEISNNIPLKNNGLIQMSNKEVFILNNATVPAIIIETGYMSSPRDLNYLNSEYGQQTIVKGIYSGIWRAYEELIPSK